MTTKTEGRHAGEFLISEANGRRSRKTGTVVTGQTLVAGQVVELDGGGKLTALTALSDTAGDIITQAEGVMWDAVDASAADVTGAVYIARDAEVNGNDMKFPTETSDGDERALSETSLELLGVVVRN